LRKECAYTDHIPEGLDQSKSQVSYMILALYKKAKQYSEGI